MGPKWLRAAIHPKPPSGPMKTTRGTTSKMRQAASMALKMGRIDAGWMGGAAAFSSAPRCTPSETGA